MSMVFIHGAGANPSVWHFQTIHFNGSVAVELPGHPNGPGLATINDYANAMEEEIERLQVRQPILVGHSMGGAIAIELALRKKPLKGLVLVGTGARLRVRPEFLSLIEQNYEDAAKLIASWSVASSADPILVDRIARDLLMIKPKVTLGDFRACDRFDSLDRIGKIVCRTLIVCGEDDRMTPRKYSEYLHQKIIGSKLAVVPGAGHGVMLEKHREFNQVLDAFLASL